MRNKQIFRFLALVFLAFTACTGKQEGGETANNNPSIPVKVQQVVKTQAKATPTLQYSGSLTARSSVLLSFLTSGKVQQVQAEVGHAVAKGQVLAQLDQTDYQSQVEIHRASFTLAQDAYNRIAKLYKRNSIPESKFIESQAKLKQAKAQLAIAEKKLADTRLVAPFNATVSRRAVELGGLVGPSVPAYELVEMQRMYVVVAVPESEIGQVRQGATVSVQVNATNAELEGVVKIISPVADAISRTFEVKIEVANDGLLRQGMLVEATFDLDAPIQQDVVFIPGNALLQSPTIGQHVFIVDKENMAKAVPVVVGDFSGEQVVIQDGLAGGEQLIVKGQHKVQNGTRLQM